MAIFVLGIASGFDEDAEWREVCRVEADSAESLVTRIWDVTDELATEHIVRWNIEHYPEKASPRMIVADMGGAGTYGELTPR